METLKINDMQKLYYNHEEEKRNYNGFKIYAETIIGMKEKEEITILDIGGGGGSLARYISSQLKTDDSRCSKIKIVVIDNVEYNSWLSNADDVEYILCDAINIGDFFNQETFDFIFCNMFVHHLIGKSYNDSADIRRNVFRGINDVLKKDGKLLIMDNFNDGFLFDSVSCRIVYKLTSCHNPILSRLFYRMGAKSAGSGVCMMSEKMWEDLLTDTGFKIVQKECSKPDKWKLIKKIVLINKAYKQGCCLMAEKEQK